MAVDTRSADGPGKAAEYYQGALRLPAIESPRRFLQRRRTERID